MAFFTGRFVRACDCATGIIDTFTCVLFTGAALATEDLYTWIGFAFSLGAVLVVWAGDFCAGVFGAGAVFAALALSTGHRGAASDTVAVAAELAICTGLALAGVFDTLCILTDFPF